MHYFVSILVLQSPLKGKRKLVALLVLSYRCIVTILNVLWLFLRVLWVGLQCVIVVFPDHTHLFYATFHLCFQFLPKYLFSGIQNENGYKKYSALCQNQIPLLGKHVVTTQSIKNLGSQGTKHGGKSEMIQTCSNTRTLCAIFLMRAAQEKKGRSCLKLIFQN